MDLVGRGVVGLERQALGGFESNACISYGTLSAIELLEGAMGRFEPTAGGYSDRYLANLSKTAGLGNKVSNVVSAVRRYGCVSEAVLPFGTGEDYYDEGCVTEGMKEEGKRWLVGREFTCKRLGSWWNGYRVDHGSIVQALAVSPVGVGVFAWAEGEKGVYVRPSGVKSNHFCLVIGVLGDGRYVVLDSYEPFLKVLEAKYLFTEAYSYGLVVKG